MFWLLALTLVSPSFIMDSKKTTYAAAVPFVYDPSWESSPHLTLYLNKRSAVSQDLNVFSIYDKELDQQEKLDDKSVDAVVAAIKNTALKYVQQTDIAVKTPSGTEASSAIQTSSPLSTAVTSSSTASTSAAAASSSTASSSSPTSSTTSSLLPASSEIAIRTSAPQISIPSFQALQSLVQPSTNPPMTKPVDNFSAFEAAQKLPQPIFLTQDKIDSTGAVNPPPPPPFFNSFNDVHGSNPAPSLPNNPPSPFLGPVGGSPDIDSLSAIGSHPPNFINLSLRPAPESMTGDPGVPMSLPADFFNPPMAPLLYVDNDFWFNAQQLYYPNQVAAGRKYFSYEAKY